MQRELLLRISTGIVPHQCSPACLTLHPPTPLRSWELPWATTSPWQIVGLVLGGLRLPLPAPEDVPGPDRLLPAVFQQYTALLQSCWAQNPYDRPPLQSVVEQLR